MPVAAEMKIVKNKLFVIKFTCEYDLRDKDGFGRDSIRANERLTL